MCRRSRLEDWGAPEAGAWIFWGRLVADRVWGVCSPNRSTVRCGKTPSPVHERIHGQSCWLHTS
jgi:hypothetical protein